MSEQQRSRTSKLLVAEPPLLVLPSLAVLVGLNEAIFLQQLHYWLLQSGKERDGRRWVYNTYDEWHSQLPFWSLATLRRIVNGLEQQGLVVSTTAYNQHKVDRTKWYSLDYARFDRLTNPADLILNLSSPSVQPEQMQALSLNSSVPETTTETTKREVEGSKVRKPSLGQKYDETRLSLLPYAEDLAREMNDQAPLSSTTTRLVKLYEQSQLDLDSFIERLMQARAITQERTAAIRTRSEGFGPKPKMGYLLAVLEDLTGPEKSSA